MKNICIGMLLISSVALGQTNSYPSSGNIKIFAVDESWAVGISIVKPSGWSGVRFTRNDPSSGDYSGNWAIGYNGDTGNDFSVSTSYNGTRYDGLIHISNATRNVGIGTSAPRGKFDVDGAGDIYLSDDLNAGAAQSLYLPGHIYISPYNGTNISYLQARRYDNSGTTSLRLRTYSNGTLTEAMHIEGDGNVGIGTITPAYKLDVSGPINASALNVNGQPIISSQWTTTGAAISYTGKVGIGTPLTNNPNNYSLAVNGTIGARDVRVEKSSTTWPDYVFEKGYNLPSLNEVENYIQEHKHLEDVPSANEVKENGYSLNEMDVILLKKVEELSLYIIQQQKEIDLLKKRLDGDK